MHLTVSPLKRVLGPETAAPGEAGYHFPGACLLSDGSVYICARRDRGMNDPYGVTEAVRWLPETDAVIPMPSPTARDLDPDGRRTAYSCYVSELSPGEFIALYGIMEPEGRSTVFDEKTYGMCRTTLRISRSHDGGKTWEAPEDLAYQTPDIMIPSRIFHTRDGIWGFHAEMHNHWEQDYVEPVQARFVYSADGGRSFDRASFIPHPADFLAGDARPTADAEGNLMSFFWGFDLRTMKDLAIYRSFSRDGGLSWSPVEPIELKKQITSPFLLENGACMCIYQERFSDRPGLYAALSMDGGRTWDEEHALGIFVKGSAPRSENAFDSGNDEAYTFGYSTLTRLSPRSALVTFWHANGGATAVSVCRLTAEPD